MVYHYIIYNHRVTTDTCIAECHLHFLTFIVGKREFHLLIAARAIVIEELSKFLIAPLRLYVVELHPFATGFSHPYGKSGRHYAVLEYAIGPVEVLVRHIIEIQWVITQIERQHLVFAQGHSRCDEPLILWEVHTLVISVLLISIIDDSIVFAINRIQQRAFLSTYVPSKFAVFERRSLAVAVLFRPSGRNPVGTQAVPSLKAFRQCSTFGCFHRSLITLGSHALAVLHDSLHQATVSCGTHLLYHAGRQLGFRYHIGGTCRDKLLLYLAIDGIILALVELRSFNKSHTRQAHRCRTH